MGIRDPSGDLVSGCDDHGISVRCKLSESGSGFRGRYLCADPCGPSHGGGLEEHAAGSGPAGGILSGIFRKIADCRIKENPVHEKNADYVLLYYSAK